MLSVVCKYLSGEYSFWFLGAFPRSQESLHSLLLGAQWQEKDDAANGNMDLISY